MGDLTCLGIESTAHTFGIGIITKDGKVLADVKSVYKPPLGKGIVPHEARLHHEKSCEKVFTNALKKSGISMEEIDVIGYSAGPGLPPCLIVGADFAIKLSKDYQKPLLPINHPCAHIEIGKLKTGAKDPLIVYLSGANTQLVAYVEGRYRVFGEVIDVPIGNCLDVIARFMGLPAPGGKEIEKLAKKGKNYIELPYVVKGMDISLSGIQTAALKLIEKGYNKADIAYSVQETCFAMLTEVTERAVAHTGKQEVLLVGGVAANRRLQEMMKIMCEERGCKMYVVPKKYASDCGTNIAWVGILAYKSGWKPHFTDKILPKWRIEEVDITWL